VCGDGICQSGETCSANGCYRDCCLAWEHFDNSAGPWYLPPDWDLRPSTVRADQVLVRVGGSYGSATAWLTGGSLRLDTRVSSTPPSFVNSVGNYYIRFVGLPAGASVRFLGRYRCNSSAHDIVVTGSSGGEARLSCVGSGVWQEGTFIASATVDFGGVWSATVGTGRTSDVVDFDFLAIERR
jgi:hypothetical protein